MVLDLIYFPPPHTGTEVAKLTSRVFKEWDIQVPIIITDNGSNMIKAFKEVRANHIAEVIENVVKSNTEKETSDEENENLYSDIEDDIAVQVSPSEIDFHQEEDRQIPFSTDPDLNSEIEESNIELENEEVDYDIFETQINEALIQIQSCVRRRNESEQEFQLRRLSCLSHRLQLVMAIFDKFKFTATRNSNSDSVGGTAASRRNIPAFVKVIARARKLASKINTSSIATPRLIELSGKKLLSDVSTRWSSNYLVMNDMYTLRKPINDVCEELGWNALSYTDWALLKNIIDLLEPFASLTQLVSGDKYVTFSSVVPCLEDLKLHLEESSKVAGLNVVSTAMLDDLKRRHDFITDENHPEFDSIYLLATSLDVNYRIFLLCDPSVQKLLVRNVVKVAKQMGIEYNSIPDDRIQDRDAPIETETPPEDNNRANLNTSSFRYLSKKLAQRLSTESPRTLSRSSSSLSTTSDVNETDSPHLLATIESELLDYFILATLELEKEKGHDSGDIGTPMKDAILYWKDNAARFPYLTKLAFSLLAIPASSASAERAFSAAGWHCLGRKNRTTQDFLASKVFLTCNKDILRPMLF